MSLLTALKGAATKLGVIKIVTVPNAAQPTRIAMRTISLKDLAKEIGTKKPTVTVPAEFNVAFDQIFSAAGIEPVPSDPPTEKWSIDKLHDLVVSTPFKEMTREAAQPAVLTALSAKKVAAKDLVKDAMARDNAIDAYGAKMFEKHKERRRNRARQKTALLDQIAGLQAQLANLAEEDKTAVRLWNEWWQKKLAYEHQMAHALGYLLQEPIVTIDADVPVDDNSV